MTIPVPERMRVIDVPVPGGPEALVIAERPVPKPAASEILVKVAAAGINRADVLQRRGQYPAPPGAPSYPGLEAAGTVAAVGGDVVEFAAGDAVCVLLQGGGYAEYCVAPAAQALPVPGGLTLIEGASLPEAYFTVWSNVFGFARLAPGEVLLVHGGSSGIGTAAIQLARAMGATVYATAGSSDKCRFCESLGAARGIDYKSEDFVAVTRDATGKRGVDVILDMVGGDYLPRNIEALAPEGRLVVIATQKGHNGTIDLARVMGKRITVTGSTLRPRPVAFKASVRARLLERVWPLFGTHALRPVVDRVFPFDAAPAAHAYMESSAHMGKIILSV
jgi:NADPH:quinone reductase